MHEPSFNHNEAQSVCNPVLLGKHPVSHPFVIPLLDDEVSGEGLSGEIVVETENGGKGKAQINLGSFSPIPSPQSTLNINAKWIGPTRELIEEDTSVR